MPQITNSPRQERASLREQLLDAAADLLAAHGYGRLRMADVAARVRVSRQTVYNEFGSKSALVEAVALRTTAEFLEGIQERLAVAESVLDGIHAATKYTIEHARENRLVAAVLGTEVGGDLAPLLTTRGEPVLRAGASSAESYLRERVPSVAAGGTAAFVADTIARLTLSYLVLPAHSPEEAADGVRRVTASLLEATSP